MPTYNVSKTRRIRSTSSSVCSLDNVTRTRLVPFGTVGGRMAGAKSPSSRNRSAAVNAACSDPNTIGMIGESPAGRSRPAFINAART